MGFARSGTLTADEVTTVTVEGHGGYVEVVRRTGTAEIWVRLDGLDPTVGGDDCHPVLGARLFDATARAVASQTVKMISAEACDYTVEGAA